ncbi:hypothetical protein RSOLAG22IIIB_11679 [Rhizoctonia solani]|uniref:NACHT domain-containing protein n=1 Tax=Rhizoctonia solani TaxID=456999 RepID=A0A0K6G9R8_9AGAM|nr:hypothetical protein RSOLAG22IIIB_11679 [Rhizoctonia solani]
MSSSGSKKFGESVKRRWNAAFSSSSQSHLLAPPANTLPPRPASALAMHSPSSNSEVPLHSGDPFPNSSLLTPTIPLVSVSSPDLALENDPPATSPNDASPNPPKRAATPSNINPLAGLCTALQSLHVGTRMFPPLNLAIGNLISCFKELEFVTGHRRDYEELILDLTTLSKSLKEYTEKSRTARMSEFIENIALRINEQIEKIESKRDQRTGKYLIDANEDNDELARWYHRIEALFRQLQLDINLSTLETLDEQIADHRLETMTPVKLALYNSMISIEINRRGCTEGTRVQVLETLNSWACTPGTPNIYWMNGMAGTGKTTIAHTFAQKLKERKLLGASFFCTRTSAECGDVGRIIPTIAYQLARYSTPFRSTLCRVLGNDRDLGSQAIMTQFEELIMKPLLEVKDVVPEGLVVIIDALDECSHKRGTEIILDVLFKFAAGLPLKFFVTSRPEPYIRNNIRTQSEQLRSVFVLHEIESSLVQDDIELYLREELASISPADAQIKRLAELSGNLFIYAATAIRYIRADNTFSVASSTRRLATVLDASAQSNQKHAEIDDLYTTILSSILQNKSLEDKEKEQMQTILWTVIYREYGDNAGNAPAILLGALRLRT